MGNELSFLFPHLKQQKLKIKLTVNNNKSFSWYPTKNSSGKLANLTILNFIKFLNPSENLLHQELILKIFHSCPELVKPYFFFLSFFCSSY